MSNYELREWIPFEKINFKNLSKNKNAISILEKNKDKINWSFLSMNPEAIHMFTEINNIFSSEIYFEIIKNMGFIDWFRFCDNPNCVNWIEILLEKNYFGYMNSEWCFLSRNTNPEAINILNKFPKKINWYWLSKNPNAIDILEKNPDKIDWKHLSLNPNAIPLLEQNPDKIDWNLLSMNPNAIPLLEKNPDKIVWKSLAKNPNAIPMLENHLFNNIEIYYWYEAIYLECLAMNPNPEIVPLFYRFLNENYNWIDPDSMEEKMKKIDRNTLFNLANNKNNPGAIKIIEDIVYLLGIDYLITKMNDEFWNVLSENPHIFVEWNGMK